jgi:transposase
MLYEEGSGRRRRRRHSAQFKAEAIAACRKPGVSIAAAALERSISANVLRRWVIEAERTEADVRVPINPVLAMNATESFVPLPLPAPTPALPSAPIHIEVRRGSTAIVVNRPASALHECALWLRELLK